MEYMRKEYCCFANDNSFMVPECMRAFSDFTQRERYISIIADGQAIRLSTETPQADPNCLTLVDRHGRIEIPNEIRRQAGMTEDNFIAFLTAPDTMILKPLSFLARIRQRMNGNPATVLRTVPAIIL